MTMQANPLTLTAIFDRNIFGLTFQTNSNSILEGYSLPFETRIADYLPNSPVKNGYTFAGWYFDEALTIVFDQNTLLTESKTLYAKWEINAYVLSFKTYGGTSIPTVSIPFNNPILLPLSPIKDGFSFTGWFLDASLIDDDLPTTMPSQDVTFHAGWKTNVYDIYFHIGHGVSMNNLSYDFNQTIDAIPTPSVEGYTFQGWFLNDSLTIPFNIDIMPAGDIELFAKWAINSYTLTFDTNGGNSINAMDVTYADGMVLPNDPVKEGYTFVAWYTDASFTTPYEPQTMPSNDLTLFAKWAINSYTLTFDTNHGELTSTSINYTYQETFPTLEEPTRQGHTFQGWFLDESLTTPFNIDSMPAGDIELYAKWETNQYTVSFVSSHLNQPILSNIVNYGEQPILPTPPDRNGYTFLGWRAGDVMIEDDWTAPDSDVVLTAVWEGLSSQAIFISTNQTTILSTTSGEAIGSLPTVEVKPGYIFLGWSLAVGDASQIVDENFLVENGLTIKLYPIWEKTTNPAIILNQYLALGFEQATSYTYEIIVFTSMMLIGIAGGLFYIKRESHGA
jgi:uncharacterized repeat protein (TIGR02543 family)